MEKVNLPLFYMIFIVFFSWVAGLLSPLFNSKNQVRVSNLYLLFFYIKNENSRKGILLMIFYNLYVLSFYSILKYDFKIRMLPICAGQWWYVYYDNEAQMCKCYNWYTRIEWKIWCFKKH